ncbi:MAG: glycerate kinase [Elusimicrobia bacterium]|nr:glycerate kinase [Elusimicrobiota bacterium]
MRILIAPNAFKGSLSPLEASRAMSDGVKAALPGAKVRMLPVSDGGDGLMEVIVHHAGGRIFKTRVRDPNGRVRPARFAVLSDGRTAVVEMAEASGLALLEGRRLIPLKATSFGTGELIRAALKKGATQIIVGLGGSATNDGGAGAAQALGVMLYDAQGKSLGAGVGQLLRLSGIDTRGIDPGLKRAGITGVSDVKNPLLGKYGSARVYGPQKGASKKEVRIMGRALLRYSHILKSQLGKDVGHMPGGGAAGGLAAGLAAFFDARLVRGADYVLELLGARSEIEMSDLVITGEGKLDFQSFFGKAPVAVCRMAKAAGKPSIFICGKCSVKNRRLLRQNGITRVVSLEEAGAAGKNAMSGAARWVKKAAEKVTGCFLANGD